MEEGAARLFKRGISLLRRGYPEDAAECLEKVLEMSYDSAACNSWLGVAIARSRYGDIIKAEEYCKKAIKKAYYRPQYHNNLAEVYLIWGKKRKAIEALGPPDLLINLVCAPGVILNRITRRGRDFETGVDISYVMALNDEVQKQVRCVEHYIPVVHIDAALHNFEKNQKDVAHVMAIINEYLATRKTVPLRKIA